MLLVALVEPNGDVNLCGLKFEEWREKQLVYGWVRKEIRKRRAVTLVAINDTWLGGDPTTPPERDPLRREGVVIYVVGCGVREVRLLHYTRQRDRVHERDVIVWGESELTKEFQVGLFGGVEEELA